MTRLMTARAVPLKGQEARLKSLVHDLARDVRTEAGNLRFEATQDENGAVVMIEEYRDDAAFDTHLAQPHTKAFNAALAQTVENGKSEVTELSYFAREDAARPDIRGTDHIGLTVPDMESATRFFADAFGAVTLYDVQPPDAPPMAGKDPEAQLGLTSGTKITHMRLMRLGNGPCIEMFCITDGQSRAPLRLQDQGLTHIGIYVDDIDTASARFARAGGTLMEGPHPLSGVEDGKGNAGIYGTTPWGLLIELLTYPSGNTANPPLPRWTPHP
ncbi:VOC family protein [Falsirhodobacter sp. alg1]|uniref:VOC family protein n=1 Tax=Falsirhodobacter sp. alg1 TaxID=1472418 RepID=UPI00192D1C4D|nr:VOC family protein [Falsirhodobacter sp. alg1]